MPQTNFHPLSTAEDLSNRERQRRNFKALNPNWQLPTWPLVYFPQSCTGGTRATRRLSSLGISFGGGSVISFHFFRLINLIWSKMWTLKKKKIWVFFCWMGIRSKIEHHKGGGEHDTKEQLTLYFTRVDTVSKRFLVWMCESGRAQIGSLSLGILKNSGKCANICVCVWRSTEANQRWKSQSCDLAVERGF